MHGGRRADYAAGRAVLGGDRVGFAVVVSIMIDLLHRILAVISGAPFSIKAIFTWDTGICVNAICWRALRCRRLLDDAAVGTAMPQR